MYCDKTIHIINNTNLYYLLYFNKAIFNTKGLIMDDLSPKDLKTILHGKTRRGELVFDIADLIKDTLVLPNAFIAAIEGDSEQEFRHRLLTVFQDASAMDYMIDVIKHTANIMSDITGATVESATGNTDI